MKLKNTTVECSLYAIVNHESSDYLSGFSKETIECEPLRCSLCQEDLKYRDASRAINGHLLNVFEAACRGEDSRWKLMRVQIKGGRLSLAFADMYSQKQQGEYYEGEIIAFSHSYLVFHVFAKRPGSISQDEYTVEYFGTNERRVASIEEYRESKYHALDSIEYVDGKYYLCSYCFE